MNEQEKDSKNCIRKQFLFCFTRITLPRNTTLKSKEIHKVRFFLPQDEFSQILDKIFFLIQKVKKNTPHTHTVFSPNKDMNNWRKIKRVWESENCSMITKQMVKHISKHIYNDLQLGEHAQEQLWLNLVML